MKLFFLFQAALLFAPPAFAENKMDPRFTFKSAKQAYASARIPRAADITGQWMQIGYVDDTSGLYFPDGKLKSASGEGHHRWITTIMQHAPDAFGNSAFQVSDSVQLVESGVMEEPYVSFRAALTPKGLSFVRFSHEERKDGADVCEATKRCRIVESTGLLLCGLDITDRACRGISTPYFYEGYVKFPQEQR